jgi:predicted phage terminase large subunit-like protein
MEFTLQELSLYAFCDPAGGKRGEIKKIRARSAIVVIGIDPALGRIFTLDAWASRATTDHLIDQIAKKNAQWRPRIFGIEANAMQSLFADALRREFRHRGLHVPILPVQQSTKVDKIFRIRSLLQPLLQRGLLFVHPTMHELLVELRGFPTHNTVDIVDALASAIALAPQRTARQAQQEENSAYINYLRDTGAPMQYITEEEKRERMLREVRHTWDQNNSQPSSGESRSWSGGLNGSRQT